jgi:CubicO group peptidase (beta-lactamase class C family)
MSYKVWVAALLAMLILSPAAARPLTGEDLEAWLDGYMPYTLQQADIAGAVVVVVKDGEVLLQKGYGYADVATHRPVDPQTTLFRPGSVSKLFTWTAVMQLVEQHRIDLDRDINTYLDFRIAPFDGQPVTLRNLMTHTAGFQDSLKDMVTAKASAPALGDFLKQQVPERVTPTMARLLRATSWSACPASCSAIMSSNTSSCPSTCATRLSANRCRRLWPRSYRAAISQGRMSPSLTRCLGRRQPAVQP